MKTYFVISLLLILTGHTFAQKQISGISLPATHPGNGQLSLNGAGIRSKYFIDLYVGALYLSTKSKDAKKIMAANEPMAVRLYIVSDMISSNKMKESVEDGFKKSTGGNAAPFQTRINDFVKVISENIHDGVIYDLIYLPEKDLTQVYKDNVLKTEIKGLDFKTVLFGIWLGTDPVDKDLKEEMLGIN